MTRPKAVGLNTLESSGKLKKSQCLDCAPDQLTQDLWEGVLGMSSCITPRVSLTSPRLGTTT